MSVHKLAILVEAVGAAEANRKLRGIDRTLSNIGARAGKGLRTAASNLAKLGIIAAGVAATGLVASVKAAADFESQLHTINTVANLSTDELAKVGDGIRKLARDTGSSLGDLTGAYYDLVSAGIKPGADALKILEQANTLAIGGLGTTKQTVDLLTTAINVYGLNAEQAALATDQFAKAIALGKVTASELAESFAIVGPIAQAAGIGIDQIAASYAVLTAKGSKANVAATDMRAAIVALMKPTKSLVKAEDVLNVNFIKVAKNKGLPAAMAMIRKYSEKSGVPLAKLLGRIEGVQYALTTTGDNADDYAAALKEMQSATGTAADQMSERQQGLNYQLSRLKTLATDAAITIGSKLLPKLTPLVERAVNFLEIHQSDISAFGDHIASAFDKAVDFAEKIPWGAVGSGLKTAADFAGKLIDLFARMPPDVQASIIALAGLNKLSGGAISGIVGELGKGLIKGVLGMNAGVVNINAAVVRGGGVGLPVPAVGGAAAGQAAAAAAGEAAAAAAAAGFATLVAGVAAPFWMLNILPRLFPGAAQAGAGAGSQPALQTRIGTISSQQNAIMTGLMPSFQSLVLANGGIPIVPPKETRNADIVTPPLLQAVKDAGDAQKRYGTKLDTIAALDRRIADKKTTFSVSPQIVIPVTTTVKIGVGQVNKAGTMYRISGGAYSGKWIPL